MAECLLFHSYLARRGGEGEWGSKLPISLHYLTKGEGSGRGLRSLPLQIPLILIAQHFSNDVTKYALTAAGASTVQFGGDNFLSVDLRPGGEEEEVTEAQDVSLRFRTQEKSGMEPNSSHRLT